MCVCSFCYHLIANVIKSAFCYQLVTNDGLSENRPNSGIIDASFEISAVGKCVSSKRLILAKVYKKLAARSVGGACRCGVWLVFRAPPYYGSDEGECADEGEPFD